MLTDADELSEACNDGLVHAVSDANPDGVTYEVRVGCCEELIVEVIDGDFDGSGVGVSEYIDDTDTNGDEDADNETLFEPVELGESELDCDGEPELDDDKVPEIVNLLEIDGPGDTDASVLLVLETV
jgi:hypothetical protein